MQNRPLYSSSGCVASWVCIGSFCFGVMCLMAVFAGGSDRGPGKGGPFVMFFICLAVWAISAAIAGGSGWWFMPPDAPEAEPRRQQPHGSQRFATGDDLRRTGNLIPEDEA